MLVKNLRRRIYKKYEPDRIVSFKAIELWDLANELDKKRVYPWDIGDDEEDYIDCEYGDEAWMKYLDKRRIEDEGV